MRYTDLIFDLYGTLVDIHTAENDSVWEKTAFFFGFHGARYTPLDLKEAFQKNMKNRESKEGQSYECFPDIPFEWVMADLFREKGVKTGADALGFQAAQLFRIASLDYIRLYPGAKELLDNLRQRGYRLWLLSNAQRVFTEYELRYLGLLDCFDGIYISSDYRCRKPDRRFYDALIRENNLDRENCLMIGNDRSTDIEGAKAAGLATLYLHTNLTPQDQAPADLSLPKDGRHLELEGWDWKGLSDALEIM